MIVTYNITSEDMQRLLADSTEIARDWDTYVQFRQNRDAILKHLALVESSN